MKSSRSIFNFCSAVLLLLVMLFITGIKTFHTHPASPAISKLHDASAKTPEAASVQQHSHCSICEFHFCKNGDVPVSVQWQGTMPEREVQSGITRPVVYYTSFQEGIFLRGPPMNG